MKSKCLAYCIEHKLDLGMLAYWDSEALRLFSEELEESTSQEDWWGFPHWDTNVKNEFYHILWSAKTAAEFVVTCKMHGFSRGWTYQYLNQQGYFRYGTKSNAKCRRFYENLCKHHNVKVLADLQAKPLYDDEWDQARKDHPELLFYPKKTWNEANA